MLARSFGTACSFGSWQPIRRASLRGGREVGADAIGGTCEVADVLVGGRLCWLPISGGNAELVEEQGLSAKSVEGKKPDKSEQDENSCFSSPKRSIVLTDCAPVFWLPFCLVLPGQTSRLSGVTAIGQNYTKKTWYPIQVVGQHEGTRETRPQLLAKQKSIIRKCRKSSGKSSISRVVLSIRLSSRWEGVVGLINICGRIWSLFTQTE
jgi:hypothetical protein